MATVLIVDDDAALREGLAETIADLGHRPMGASNGRIALETAARESIDAVLLDLRIPGMDGLEILRRLRELPSGAPPVAILTAYASANNTIEAMRFGAFDHLTNPVGRDDLAALMARMLQLRGGAKTTAAASNEVDEGLIGTSEAMRQVQKLIGLVTDTNATVLITGETGTGKELVARAIHRRGRRSLAPFIAVNCAAIPAELLESELFDHVRGAFTGAIADRKGAFRDAHGGTLFLDEIGDMDPATQAKILRAFEERCVTPVGGRTARVDVRVLAATNRDLAVCVANGSFREDLFYRLNVVPIKLAPLRERGADIVPLAEYFLRRATDPAKQLSGEATARLLAYPWPGNVRELKNAVERVAILCRGRIVTGPDFEFLSNTLPPGPQRLRQDWTQGNLSTALGRLESFMIARALRESKGNRSEAAKRLGINRQLLYSKLQKYGIDHDGLSADHTGDVANADGSRLEPP